MGIERVDHGKIRIHIDAWCPRACRLNTQLFIGLRQGLVHAAGRLLSRKQGCRLRCSKRKDRDPRSFPQAGCAKCFLIHGSPYF
jgi:hypothetical protein